MELKKGKTIKLTSDPAFFYKGSSELIYVDYPNMYNVVHVDGRVYMDDGLISLIVKEIGTNKSVHLYVFYINRCFYSI